VLFPDESSECLGLILRTSAGKTIPPAMGGNLRMQHYHAALRHRDPAPLSRRRPRPLAGTALGDLRRDSAGFVCGELRTLYELDGVVARVEIIDLALDMVLIWVFIIHARFKSMVDAPYR
jgi:hypothetical protein